MKKLILTSMACLLFAAAASAEDMKFYVGADLRSINNMWNNMNGYNNALFIGFKKDNLRFEIHPRLYYDTSEEKNDPGAKVETTTTRLGLGGNAYYDFAKSGFITPFVGAGVSFGQELYERESNGTKLNDRKSPGYTLGAQGGVSLSLSESWSFDVPLGLNYTWDRTKESVTGAKRTTTGYGFDLGMRIRYAF